MPKLIRLFTMVALGAACSESSTTLTGPVAMDSARLAIATAHWLPAPVDVQFEDPELTGATAVFDVFQDPHTGIRFTAVTAHPHISINLLNNTAVATSSCTPPADPEQQILGTGSVDQPGHAGEAIEALFPVPVPPNRIVSVQFQAGTGAPVRMRLYDSEGRVVASVTERITDEAGACGIASGSEQISRGRLVLQVSATVHVERAVFDVPRLQPFGFVFAIDDLRIEPPRGRGNRPGRHGG